MHTYYVMIRVDLINYSWHAMCRNLLLQMNELDSSIEYVSEYEEDPDYDGPKSASQPFPGRHGASYTPNGWRKVYRPRKY